MRTLIIYAHPWEKSFNHHVLETTTKLLEEKGHEVDIIDLNKDGFNPVMRQEDLKEFAKGEYADKLAGHYAARLKGADELVFIFPIWWYGEPAILKGFYEKVFLKGHTYKEKDRKLVGVLGVNKATILTTANIDKTIFSYLGDPIQNVLANGILKTIGVTNVTWLHCPTVHIEESRINYLAEINAHFSK
ncbi:NAD(P)H-dependent oxidoreductase [Acholeplasma granularum]|uniref:NAD(P)H-dependent oxidoreductase n=1 Tax=Acholeplasma granularum TaxID=264635 RepID=UPI000470EDB8|nr:NAD(P)H-dependent oxidoreductase [Acholeplasma granularum]